MKTLIAVLAVLVLTLASGLADPYAGGNGNEFSNNGRDMKTRHMISRERPDEITNPSGTGLTGGPYNKILSNPNISYWRGPVFFILHNGQIQRVGKTLFLSHDPAFGEKVYVTNNQRLILSYTPQPGQCWTMYATQTLPSR
jgi:hypothetical protein